jgi:formylglycine-generating enzyme required for sulfatase activity
VARIESAGNGGQILLSLATQQLVRENLPAECQLRDLGTHRLKDLRYTETLFQLLAPDLPDVTLPLNTVETLHARDRIIIVGAGEDDVAQAPSVRTSVEEALDATLAAIRDKDEQRTVSLTPQQLAEIAHHRPANLTEYRLGRIAEWSQPQFRLDGRFVGLTLLIDRGEEATSVRWASGEDRFKGLRDLLAAVEEPALVMLGAPGAGKSTLLRRLELDTAIDMLRREPGTQGEGEVTYFIQLNHFKPEAPGAPLPAPGAWLSQNWQRRFPDLPPFESFLEQGRMILLLDALNEVPADNEAAYFEIVSLWKTFLHDTVSQYPGTRVVFSCRSLEYSAPLSTPGLRVPQIRIERLTDEQVIRFLELYSPAHWRDIWEQLDGSPQLALLRSPYFLKLLTDQVEAEGHIPQGRAGLFAGFVRQSLRREIERGNPLFGPGKLLESRDIRRITRWKWKTPWELPDRGILVNKLYHLAFELQSNRSESKASQVRVDYDDALDILDDDRDEEILKAGAALSVLDEDTVNDQVLFIHQLVQEFFASQQLATRPTEAPDMVRMPWRADEVTPSLEDAKAMIAPADPLPTLPATGWEQTILLASAMTPDPDTFVRALMDANLALAGECAAQPDARVSDTLLDELRIALAERSRNPEADMRARIAAGLALGALGDHRLERVTGSDGEGRLPSLVTIPAGTYIVGQDDTGDPLDGPAHPVQLNAFRLGAHQVTNAEYARFMAADGYNDPRWWSSKAGLAWQRGEGTAEGQRNAARFWRDHYQANPEALAQLHASGSFSDERYELECSRQTMDDHAFEQHLQEYFPGGRILRPMFWNDERFNAPAQPVIGVCWFEARAYCRWLSAQSCQSFRLPTGPEWESAARGSESRVYAFGNTFEPSACNTMESHVRGTTPVGVFPLGDTPEGLMDMTGNVWEWTSTATGKRLDKPDYRYPYKNDDGREDLDTGAEVIRSAQGGGWWHGREIVFAYTHYGLFPDARNFNLGFRLAVSGED